MSDPLAPVPRARSPPLRVSSSPTFSPVRRRSALRAAADRVFDWFQPGGEERRAIISRPRRRRLLLLSESPLSHFFGSPDGVVGRAGVYGRQGRGRGGRELTHAGGDGERFDRRHRPSPPLSGAAAAPAALSGGGMMTFARAGAGVPRSVSAALPQAGEALGRAPRCRPRPREAPPAFACWRALARGPRSVRWRRGRAAARPPRESLLARPILRGASERCMASPSPVTGADRIQDVRSSVTEGARARSGSACTWRATDE